MWWRWVLSLSKYLMNLELKYDIVCDDSILKLSCPRRRRRRESDFSGWLCMMTFSERKCHRHLLLLVHLCFLPIHCYIHDECKWSWSCWFYAQSPRGTSTFPCIHTSFCNVNVDRNVVSFVVSCTGSSWMFLTDKILYIFAPIDPLLNCVVILTSS